MARSSTTCRSSAPTEGTWASWTPSRAIGSSSPRTTRNRTAKNTATFRSAPSPGWMVVWCAFHARRANARRHGNRIEHGAAARAPPRRGNRSGPGGARSAARQPRRQAWRAEGPARARHERPSPWTAGPDLLWRPPPGGRRPRPPRPASACLAHHLSRTRKSIAMQQQHAQQIREHMEVVGSDGGHVGTVDKVEGDRIKLTKKDDPDGTGAHHHYLSLE